MERNTCFYCGEQLAERSKEHIISNSIGGLYVSKDVCCRKCNTILSKKESKFTKIFNPIISKIDNFPRTYRNRELLSCSGIVEYQGQFFNAVIKNGKVVECKAASSIYQRNAKDIDFNIIGYSFEIDNKCFAQGITKIAVEFAVDKGVDDSILSGAVWVKRNDKGAVEDICFRALVLPFFPLNPMDFYLETETDFRLYHHLLLFSHENELWCYVDLFNTFQYYVLLSDKFPKNTKISETYIQDVQRIDRTLPDIMNNIKKTKDILLFSQFYNVSPTMDIKELERRIKKSIAGKSPRRTLEDVISPKLAMYSEYHNAVECGSNEEKTLYFLSLLLYFDEDDTIIKDNYRTVTLTGNEMEIISYPSLIYSLLYEDNAYANLLSNALVRWLFREFDEGKRTMDAVLKKYTNTKLSRLEMFIKQSDQH